MALDSLNLVEARDFLADDYGNFYVAKQLDFSFTKFDSLGTEKAKVMFTMPYKIQSIQNPLNIFAFSGNAQVMRIYDENLVEKQKIDFSKNFLNVVQAYGLDLQSVWLLEASTQKLIQWKYRENTILNSFLVKFPLNDLVDFQVYKNKIYLLLKDRFLIYNLQSEKLFDIKIENGRRLRRESDRIYIITNAKIYEFDTDFKLVFDQPAASFVEKNNRNFLALVKNKLYIYKLK